MNFTNFILVFGLIFLPLLNAKAEKIYVKLIEKENELQRQLQENLANQKIKSETIFTWNTFKSQSTLLEEHESLLKQIAEVKAEKRRHEESVEAISKQDSADAIDLLVAQKPLRKDKKRFVFVNGGLNAAQNYVSFDRTAVALNRHVFDNNLLVLSARGNNSPVMIPDDEINDIKRHPTGEAIYNVWQAEEDVPIQPATKGNFNAIIDQVKDEEAKELNLIFYDHGDEDGVSFWYHDIDQTHLASQYSKLGDDTTIRALHFHCHSEHAFSDLKRKIPKDNPSMAEFIQKYYPKNYCALGASRAEEVARNPDDTYKNNESNYFVKIAKYSPPFSLDRIRERIAIDWSLPSTPILTSDLLLEDINKFVCQKVHSQRADELFEGCEKNQADAQPAASAGRETNISSYQAIFDELCGNDLIQEIQAHTKKLEEISEESQQLRREVMNHRKDFIEKTNPGLHKRVQQYYAEQDRYMKLMALAEDPDKFEGLFRYALIQSRKDLGLEEYHFNLLYNVDWDENPEFHQFVDSKRSVDYYKQYSKRLNKEQKERSRERKKLEEQLRDKRRLLADELFQLPLFKDAKETYDKVRECETSPLN